jgi:hypothetical protein
MRLSQREQLTAGEDLSLLNRELIEDGARLQDLDILRAGVGDNSLDSRVANLLELDIERGGALGNINRGSGGQGGEARGDGEDLHGGGDRSSRGRR